MELDTIKRTWAEIDLTAARMNFEAIKKHIGNSKVCCVVKADGYGHGAQKLANLYSKLGAEHFAVSNIDEAVELRESGIKEPILVLGFTPVKLAAKLSAYNIEQTVYSLEYANELSKACEKSGVSIDVHIKLDTGMSRLGFMCQSFPEDTQSIDDIEKTCKLPCLKIQGVMAHFAVADEGEAGKEFTNAQFDAFNTAIKLLADRGISFRLVHHANSGAIEYYRDTHRNMVRAGIILYGLAPNPAIDNEIPLKPAMTLKSTIAHVKKLRKGASVSYGRTFVADRDMVVATVPIGYADGYLRAISKDGYMGIKGKSAKILGRICMDQTVVDVTDIPDVKIGDEVVIFSDGNDGAPTVNDLAKFADTINYEIICAVSKRVPRVYMENGKVVDVMYKL
ncbi:MAG: alanine racemase [Ruminococcaceae bacterium]|nr:alanine racemase [Oscillospiraceae bacterium]